MEQSETIGKLTAALSKMQATIRGYTEKSKNPHFKSKYGSLTDVWAAIREPLTDNGLAVIQTMEPSDGDSVIVVTTLAHTSGEWIRGRLRLPFGRGSGPQAAGSAITYARRYALAAICGVAPEDDDAEAAEGRRAGRGDGRHDGDASDTSEARAKFEVKKGAIEEAIGKALAKDVFLAVKAWSKGGPDDMTTVTAWCDLCELIRDDGATMATVMDVLNLSRPGSLDELEGHIGDWVMSNRPADAIKEEDLPF